MSGGSSGGSINLHDKKTWEKFDDWFSEADFRELMESVAANLCIRDAQVEMLDNIASHFAMTENKFLSENLQHHALSFANSVGMLNAEMSKKLFPVSRGAEDVPLYCLYPEQRHTDFWEEQAEHVRQYIQIAVECWEAFRIKVKEDLQI